MERQRSFFGELLRPWWVRIAFLSTVAIPSYDAAANQFGLPKLPALWGMTGSLLPWWGWLLVFQGVLMLALFEYVRRNVPMNGGSQSNLAIAETANSDTPLASMTDFDADQAIIDALARPRPDGWPSTPHPQAGSIEHAFNELHRLIIAVALKDRLPNLLHEIETVSERDQNLWNEFEKAVRKEILPNDPGHYHTTVAHARNAVERHRREIKGLYEATGINWPDPDAEIDATQPPPPLPNGISDQAVYDRFCKDSAEQYRFSRRVEKAHTALQNEIAGLRSVVWREMKRHRGAIVWPGPTIAPISLGSDNHE